VVAAEVALLLEAGHLLEDFHKLQLGSLQLSKQDSYWRIFSKLQLCSLQLSKQDPY
jgi:hypothetical protein